VLRTDNGGEYIDEESAVYCRSKHITREYSPPHSQSDDGVSENYWREVARSVRAILWDQQRDDQWRPVAMEFANEIRNHLDCESVDRSDIPEVEWTGKAVDVSHWRVPMATSWSYIEKTGRHRGTLGDQRDKGVLVGYAKDSRCYEVLPDDGDIVLNRRYEDVKVDEKEQAPIRARRRHDLEAIPEEAATDGSVIDIGNDSSEEGEDPDGGPAKKKQAVGGSAEGARKTPLIALTEHCDDKFYLTKKVMAVKQLAEMFACDPLEYLRLLRQYDGCYQQLTTTTSKVAARSDVPVPRPAAEAIAPIVPPGVRGEVSTTRIGVAGSRAHGGGNTAGRAAGGRTTAGVPRRSKRLQFLHEEEEVEKDAAALLAVAADFERQATTATKAPREEPVVPARQGASVFFAVDHLADDGWPNVDAVDNGRAMVT
jgi:hypothetical protein